MNSTHGMATELPRARYLAESDADGISVQPGWETLKKFAFPKGKSANELRILPIRFYDQIRRILGLPCALCAGDIVIAEFVHALPRIDRVAVYKL